MFFVYYLFAFYFSLFAHEIGHAFWGWRGGYLVTSFGIGMGKPLWVSDWRGIRVFLCRGMRGGTAFVVSPQLLPARKQQLLFYAGGLLANAILMLTGLGIFALLPDGRELGMAIVLVNGALLLNVFPFQANLGPVRLASDGAQILAVLQGKQTVSPPGAVIRHVATLRPFLTAIGNTNTLYEFLIAEASAYSQIGDRQAALRVYNEALGLPMPDWAFRRAHAMLVQSIAATLRGDAAEHDAALDQAERGFEELKHEIGLRLTRITRAEVLLKSQPDAARLALNRLADDPVIGQHGSLQRSVRLQQLLASVAMERYEDAHSLFSVYETVRKKAPSSAEEANYCHAMAQLACRCGDWSQAETYYHRALQAVATIYRTCPNAETKACFAQSQSDFLAEMQDCLRHTDKAAEAEKLIAYFSDIDAEVEKRAEKTAQSQRKALHQTRWMDGVSIAIFVASLAYGKLSLDNVSHDGLHGVERGNDLLLIFMTVLTGIFALALYGLRFVSPAWRQSGGKISLALAVTPSIIYILFRIFV